MIVRRLLIAAAALALALPVIASAQFSEDFDSYAPGTSMHGVNGWKGWDNNPAATAYTTDLLSLSAPNSVAISPTSDLVHEFSDYTLGVWIVSAQQYIPSSATGSQYFILLNTYADAGPYNWSTEIQFANGVVTDDATGVTLPLITDQWVEIRVEIDLDADTQSIYYGGTLLVAASWTEGLTGGGALSVAALDLFSNNATDIYYDDVTIEAGGPTPVKESSWGQIKAQFKN